jgi:hypothetical protein
VTLDAIETFVLRAALADWLQSVAAPNRLHVCARRIYGELYAAGRLNAADVALDADDLRSLSVIMHTYAPRGLCPLQCGWNSPRCGGASRTRRSTPRR